MHVVYTVYRAPALPIAKFHKTSPIATKLKNKAHNTATKDLCSCLAA